MFAPVSAEPRTKATQSSEGLARRTLDTRLQRLARSLKDHKPVVSDGLDFEFFDAERQHILERDRASWHVHLRKPAGPDAYLGADVQVWGTNAARADRVPMKRQELATALLTDFDEVGSTDSCPAVRLLHGREVLGHRQHQRRVSTQRDCITVAENDGARLLRREMQSATDHVAPS